VEGRIFYRCCAIQNFDFDGVPRLRSSNTFDFTVSISGPTLDTVMFAKLDTDAFLSFPLVEILNTNCLLALFQPGDTREIGRLGFQESSLNLSTFHMAINCPSGTLCTSGVVLESAVFFFENMQKLGLTAKLGNGILDVIEFWLLGEHTQLAINEITADPAMQCPQVRVSETSIEENGILKKDPPVLSRSAIESAVFLLSLPGQGGG